MIVRKSGHHFLWKRWICCALFAMLAAVFPIRPSTASSPADVVSELVWREFYQAGRERIKSNQYDDAERCLKAAITYAGADSRRLLLTLNALNDLYDASEQFAKEESVLVVAIAAASECIGNKDEYVALLYGKLSRVESQLEKFDAAIQHANKAISILESIDPGGVELGLTLHNLGWIYVQSGDEAQAEKTYKRAIAVQARTKFSDELLPALTKVNLAQLYVEQGRFPEGLLLYRAALQALSKRLGANSAVVQRIQGLYKDAVRSFEHSKKQKRLASPKDVC